MINGVRFDEPLEADFQRSFGVMGRRSRHEMWAVLLVVLTAGIAFHHVLLRVPPEVMPLGRTLLVAVAIPMMLRWLSGDHSPLQRWSSLLYIASVYIDVGVLMLLRIACIRHGLDVVPLAMPVAILMSLIVVQIRFVLLAPAILVGLVGLIVSELLAFDATSNRLFGLAASVALVTVALSAAYELERSTRIGWLRARTLAGLTRTDALTGVPNRRFFDERLAELAHDAQHNRQNLAVLAIDLDDFKAFNDRYGHLAGDDCLRLFGSYLADTMCAENEFCARLGGEEFVAVWCDTDPAAIATRAEAIRSGIAELAISRDAEGNVVTASAGLACRSAPDRSSAEQLLGQADVALYQAKHAGRDQLVVAEPTSDGRPRRRLTGPRQTEIPAGRASATVLQPARMTAAHEVEFRAVFDRQGRISRAAIMLGLDAVCVAILLTQRTVLKIPEAAVVLGAHTLIFGLMPAATLAAVTALVPRLYRWSVPMFIVAVAIITSAQMLERVLQLPHGYDVVPYLMPTSVLLSMCVVKIRFGLLAPALTAILLWTSAIELWAFPWTSNRLLTVGTTALMAAVTLRFAYKLEQSVRLAWLDERTLDELSRLDPLTELPNRRAFEEALDAIDDATGTVHAAVMILDLDDFKGFNDRFGHPAGDDALRTVGGYLRDAAAGADVLVARVGGEEFAALWHGGVDGDRQATAEALRRGIVELGPIAGTGTALTASAGFAQAALTPRGAAGRSARDLVERADRGLYDAKGRGRDRLVEITADTARRLAPPVRYE